MKVKTPRARLPTTVLVTSDITETEFCTIVSNEDFASARIVNVPIGLLPYLTVASIVKSLSDNTETVPVPELTTNISPLAKS